MTDSTRSQTLDDVFNGLRSSDLLAWISERRQEDLTLDFKVAAKGFEPPAERKVLAEAISGFSNSSGGLIVWGIDARKDRETGIDCAAEAQPIVDPERFLSNLTRYSGTAVSPPAADVVHRLTDTKEFAVTLVPETDGDPRMAKFGHDRYFQRIGDSFYRMEHYAIADMFGRRRRPVLTLQLEKEGFGGTILVLLVNTGRGTAKAPYLRLTPHSGFRCSAHGFDGNGSTGLPQIGRGSVHDFFSGDASEVIHPGQTLVVTKIEALAITPQGKPATKGPKTFKYELAAEDVPLTSGEIVLNYGDDT